MALLHAGRRFLIGPGTWSLRSNMEQALRDAGPQVDVHLDRLQALSKVEADNAEAGVRSILSWTRQIQGAPVSIDTEPISSPLDYWGYTMRLTEDEDLDGESTCDDILAVAPNREGRWFRLPKSSSET